MTLTLGHGITFHHFHGGAHPESQGSVSAKAFEEKLNAVGLRNFLTPEEWIRKSAMGTLDPSDRTITFDDNLRSQYDIALPVLEKLKLKAFWFINTSVLEGKIELLEVFRHFRTLTYVKIDSFYDDFHSALRNSPWREEVSEKMSRFSPAEYLKGFEFYTEADKQFRFVRDEILGPERYALVAEELMHRKGFDPRAKKWAELLWMDGECLKTLDRNGHVVGMHSHSHPTRIGELRIEEQRSEYRKCHSILREAIGRPPEAMSHPCNSYNADTLTVLRELGIQTGFRANTLLHPYSNLEQPRLDHALIPI